jgi:crotonobetainyl-CoA:carnitine CoA-transferase CaiB-like acyl-CoA transferase
VEPRSAFREVTVLDLSVFPAGAIAAMHLAVFGADVLRVDAGRDRSAADLPMWLYAHRMKRSVPATESMIRELAEGADVVIVDRPHAELAGSGLAREQLRAHNPAVIHAWLPPHAPHGPAAELPADELLLWAWTGLADQEPGATSDHPVAPVVPLVTYEQGALGATAIAAALVDRATTGAPRALTVSGLHAVNAMNTSIRIEMPGIYRPFGAQKDGTGASPQFRMYQCRDRAWIFICALTPAFFLRVLEAMDLMELMVMPGVDGDFRRMIDPEIQQIASTRLARRMAEHDSAEWARRFDAARVPYAPVQTRGEWAESETVAANQLLLASSHPEYGDMQVPGLPVELSRTPGAVEPIVASVEAQADEATPAPRRSARDAAATGDRATLPLDGLVVIDATKFLAGPFGCLVLQDLGATVIKVDPPGGEDFRAIAGASYCALNRDKAQVCLDLADTVDRDAFASLVQRADVLVENMSDQVVEELRLDLPGMREANPRLVHCHIDGWGAGPLHGSPGFDPLLQARGGLMAAQGGLESPVIQPMSVHDIGTGTLAAFGVVAATYARVHLGSGQEVRASLSRSSIAFQAAEYTTYSQRPEPLVGCLDYVGDRPDHRLYRCSDGWVAVSATSAIERTAWQAMTAGEGAGTVAYDDDRFLARTARSVVAACQAAGVPAVEVLSRDDVYADEAMAENACFLTVDDDDLGEVRVVRGFSDWDGVAPRDRAVMHTAGRDTNAVLHGGRVT